MVLGYHVILGMYGFWLPNDPRGSWSEFVWAPDLRKYGPARKVHDGRSRAHDSHDHQKRLNAKQDLRYPPVQINGQQALAVSRGIVKAMSVKPFPVWACSILPEHTHLVIGRSEFSIEEVVTEIKQRATLRLGEENLHPMEDHRTPSRRRHSPWERGFWVVYLSSEQQVEHAINYANRNPEEKNLPRQQWSFVTRHGL